MDECTNAISLLEAIREPNVGFLLVSIANLLLTVILFNHMGNK